MLSLVSLILFLGNTSGASEQMSCPPDNNNFHCVKYIKNYDGDTFTVDIPNTHPLFGKNISVRVVGIDTPEMKSASKCEKEKARLAQKLVEELLSKAKSISLINVDRDKYFRILADVEIDKKYLLSKILIEKKLAYPYYGEKKQKIDWCKF